VFGACSFLVGTLLEVFLPNRGAPKPLGCKGGWSPIASTPAPEIGFLHSPDLRIHYAHRYSGKRSTTIVTRKFIILFVVAFASVFGAVAWSGEVQVDEPDEVRVQIQDGEQEEH
jgi:hypothetical protein